MQKTYWCGAKDNEVRFANHQNSLTSQGINNPTSFTVTGEVEGLSLIDSSDEQQTNQSSGGAVAA